MEKHLTKHIFEVAIRFGIAKLEKIAFFYFRHENFRFCVFNIPLPIYHLLVVLEIRNFRIRMSNLFAC